MKQKIYSILPGLIFGGLVISFLVGFYVFAWTEPTAVPPGGNVPAPINVSANAQNKLGDFGIGGGAGQPIYWLSDVGGTLRFNSTSPAGTRLVIGQDGNVGIGTPGPTAKLHIGGTAGTDGIKFPDGTLQTTAKVPTWRIKMGDKAGVADGYTLPSQFTNPKYTWYEPEGLFFHSEHGNSFVELARSSLMEIRVRSNGAQSKRIYFRYVWAHLFFYLNGALVYESNDDHGFVNGSDPYYTFNLVDGINTIQIVYHRHDGNNRVWIAGNMVDNVNTFFVPF